MEINEEIERMKWNMGKQLDFQQVRKFNDFLIFLFRKNIVIMLIRYVNVNVILEMKILEG